MKCIMALDVGDKRIGVAKSDLLQVIASPYETYTRKGTDKDDIDFLYLSKLFVDLMAETVVIGMPYAMDGTDSPQTTKVRQFIEKLKTFTDLKIVTVDERLSSWAAEQMLLEGDMRREKRKQVIDKVAASIILKNYMDRV